MPTTTSPPIRRATTTSTLNSGPDWASRFPGVDPTLCYQITPNEGRATYADGLYCEFGYSSSWEQLDVARTGALRLGSEVIFELFYWADLNQRDADLEYWRSFASEETKCGGVTAQAS